MANPLNTQFNKATWTTAANALITLINGRLPEDIRLSLDEMGLLMTVLSAVLIALIPNKET